MSRLDYIGTGLQLRMCTLKSFSYFSTKAYVVGSQTKPLKETILLSTQAHVEIDG